MLNDQLRELFSVDELDRDSFLPHVLFGCLYGVRGDRPRRDDHPKRGRLSFDAADQLLNDLARHPATARHVCEKFARHFVADQPPPSLVEKLERRFRETDGNLKELAKTLIVAPESWLAERSKIKRPGEWVIGALRATGVTPPDIRPVIQAQNMLGEPLWRPPAPKGFSDDNAAWLDGLAQRIDVANAFAQRAAARLDPETVAETALGPLASAETRRTIAGAESKAQALALLLMAPEFQRR